MSWDQQPDSGYLAHEAKKERWAKDSEPFAGCRPSEVTAIPWLYVKRKQGEHPAATPKSGKWLVPLSEAKLDQIWPIVKQATEEGKLGQASMAMTALSSRRKAKSGMKVLCVFTYDWTDAQDACRIRKTLRELGITKKIKYKTDEDTRAGRYGFGYKYYE